MTASPDDPLRGSDEESDLPAKERAKLRLKALEDLKRMKRQKETENHETEKDDSGKED
jgi:hypothetical protein